MRDSPLHPYRRGPRRQWRTELSRLDPHRPQCGPEGVVDVDEKRIVDVDEKMSPASILTMVSLLLLRKRPRSENAGADARVDTSDQ